jgi:metal-sulfur cluster biosynthetic enzyme
MATPLPTNTLFTYPLPDTSLTRIEQEIIKALRTVYDPDIRKFSIYDLGLIYKIDLTPNGIVSIEMTLTSASCPYAQILPGRVKSAVSAVPGVVETQVTLVWDPPWTLEKVPEAVRLELGLI